MKTIFDVDGNPSVVDRDDTTVVVQISSAGSDQASATEIPASTGHTIALVAPAGTDTGVRLPSAAKVGDLVEVARPATFTIKLYPPTGESFIQGTFFDPGAGSSFRKVSSTEWIGF